MYTVVSLFAGIGGIDLGFKQAGFDIVWANEMDHAACETYRHNFEPNHLVEGDIRKIDATTIPQADVLAAGFPCQSFSIAGAKRGFADSRGQLFFEVIRIADAIRPKVIFLENVENLMEHDNGRTFQVIYTSLVELGYILHYRPMPTHEYANIPQTRRRIYVVATRDVEFSQKFHFPEPIPLTVKAMDLMDLSVRQPDIYYYSEDTESDRRVRNCVSDSRYFYRIFNGSIQIMHNGKCPTITASMRTKQNAAVVRDNFGVRRLTLRECLRFQGFPTTFYFPKTITLEDAYKQIGNSITVPVVQRIANAILTVLRKTTVPGTIVNKKDILTN